MKNKEGLTKIILLILFFIIMAYLGSKLRKEENAEKQLDKQAEDYFKKLDSVEGTK